MKIQCNACEAAEANVMCCADEAALCWSCDEKVHAANKLASKHRRVRLTNSSSKMPKCDICQESAGYFFCLEDRALLCGECDIAIHTANEFVSAHHRFLLTGVRIETEPTEARPSPASVKIQSSTCFSNASGSRLSSASAKPHQSPVPLEQTKPLTSKVTRVPHGIAYTETTPATHLNELLGLTEFSGIYSRKFEVSGMGLVQNDCSISSQATENEPDIDECFCKVPDVSWEVPNMPSEEQYGPFWAKNARAIALDGVASVPDVSFLPVETPRLQPSSSNQWQLYF